MSLWGKVGMALVMAVGAVIQALFVLIFVPGGWKLLLVLTIIVVIAGYGFWVYVENSHPSSPRRDDGNRWDPHKER